MAPSAEPARREHYRHVLVLAGLDEAPTAGDDEVAAIGPEPLERAG